MKKTHELLLYQIAELGQVVLGLHEDLQRWRDTPLTSVEKTSLSCKLTAALAKQREIVGALIDEPNDN